MKGPRDLLTCFLLSQVLVACSIYVRPPDVVTGSRYRSHPDPKIEDPSVARLQAKDNTERLKRLYAEDEWPFHAARATDPGAPATPPKLCVALSGGGIRSAAFATGILRGLQSVRTSQNRSIFDAVDLMSGTSGGAYALSWYYVQKHFGKEDKNIFNKDGEIKKLYNRASFYPAWLYVSVGFGNFLLSPLNLLVNGLFGWHMNTSWFGYTYDWAIRETFHDGKSVLFKDLATTIKNKRLPPFVITATARLDEDMYHRDALLALTVFEFTPFKWGSDAFGYERIDQHMSIDWATAVAGSAPDSTQVFAGASQRVVGSQLNFDVGRFITNPFKKEKQSKVPEWLEYFAPLPVYLALEGYKRDSNGRRIYLSDGGHQDNLAAYPLVRRLCENIIIVDGEEDENYWFDSYFKFRDAVKRETGANMRLMPRPWKTPNGVEIVQDIDALDSLKKTLEQRKKRSLFKEAVPVVKGAIGPFPTLDQVGEVQWKTINVVYVKLAVDPTPFENWDTKTDAEQRDVYAEYGEKMSKFYRSTARTEEAAKAGSFDCGTGWLVPCVFPQLGTFHQSFSPMQFQAYVELGTSTVCHHLVYDGTKIDVRSLPVASTDATRCFQHFDGTSQ